MDTIKGGVTTAKGFKAAGMHVGLKKSGKPDMAMIYSETPCRVAGTFTTNLVKAAPVLWDREIVTAQKESQVVLINSGVANACTGQEGMGYCKETADAVASALSVSPETVLLCSTGVIGQQLPMDTMKAGVAMIAPTLADGAAAGTDAARAIMTTDAVLKECAAVFSLTDGTEIAIGGMTKGSGMIHPNMCTMLAFLTTDLAIEQTLLQKALSSVVPDSFNMISVDGDTSTNDTCLLLANGAAGNPILTEENEDYRRFSEALLAVCVALAKMMAADGEGATALFEMQVKGAKSKEDAQIIARSVVSSTLTKAAIYGHDANWGRILCAMGYAGPVFDPEAVDLSIESAAGVVEILKDGVATGYSEEKATAVLSESAIRIVADLHAGSFEATAWGCDLTHQYVDINASYRS